jgi:hypothetical protein
MTQCCVYLSKPSADSKNRDREEKLDFSEDRDGIVNDGHCKNCNRTRPIGKNSNLDRDARATADRCDTPQSGDTGDVFQGTSR